MVGLMFPHRHGIIKIMTNLQGADDVHHTLTTIEEVRTKKKKRRASIEDLAVSLQWLESKFEQFQSDRWWFGSFSIVIRLCQSSLMMVFQNQAVQSIFACLIAQVAICSQRNLAPFRRESDNEIALLSQWVIFVWCTAMNMRVTGALASLPSVVVGLVCVVPTVALMVRSWKKTSAELETQLSSNRSATEAPTSDPDLVDGDSVSVEVSQVTPSDGSADDGTGPLGATALVASSPSFMCSNFCDAEDDDPMTREELQMMVLKQKDELVKQKDELLKQKDESKQNSKQSADEISRLQTEIQRLLGELRRG